MSLPFLPTDIRVKTYKTRSTLDKMTSYEIRKHCVLPLENVKELFEILEPFLEKPTLRGNAVPAETCLIAALSFFKSGSFQYVESTVSGVSQSTVSRTLKKLSTDIVNNFVKDYIQFPTDIPSLNKIKQDFFDIARFPNIGGVIDGTHVGMTAPSDQKNAYVNRKGFHSINTQLVCAPNNSILDAVVKWPGCTNDSYIWNNCALKEKFDADTFGETWLVGDSGYGVQHYLLAPFLNPVIIARCCGLILSLLFLHNYYIFRKVPLTEDDELFLQTFTLDDMTAPHGIVDSESGIATRENVVLNYFTAN